jgi:hypothetical protein
MNMSEFVEQLTDKVRQLSKVSYEGPCIQFKHKLLLEQHVELIDMMQLALANDDAYPLAVALDMVDELRYSTKELAALLKAGT